MTIDTKMCLLLNLNRVAYKTTPPMKGASYAGRQARLRLSDRGTDRANILAFRPSCRKSSVLPVRFTTATTGTTRDLAIKIIEAVCKLSLGSSTDKLLLLMLANHANPKGRCRPGIALLSQETDLSRRAIFDSLKRLTASGYIEVIHRHRHSNTFQIVLGAVGAPQSAAAAPQSAAAAPQSAAAAPRTVLEPSYEPSRNLKRGKDRLETGAERRQSEMALLTVIAGVERYRKAGNPTPAVSISPASPEPWGGRKNPRWDTTEGKELSARAKAIGYRDMSPHEDLEHYRTAIAWFDETRKHSG
jgi:Helix-turn-helix domain